MLRFAAVALILLLPTPLYAQPAGDATATSILSTAGKLERKVSRLRGIRRRRTVTKAVFSRQQLAQKVQEGLARDHTDEGLLAEAAIWRRLGLIPPGLDYKKTIKSIALEQVAGFYDPHKRKLYLPDWLSAASQKAAMVHEICHALQDQRFNLKRLLRPHKDGSDRRLARAALVEGDCTGVMVEYLLAPKKLDLSNLPQDAADAIKKQTTNTAGKALSAAPRLLRERLLFPYIHGLAFVQKIRRKHRWSVVSRVFKRPPQSTEQVLHYRKYWDKERPVQIRTRTLKTLKGGKYKEIQTDTLGEFQLFVYLAQASGDEAARRAAAGWGGDRLLAFVPEHKPEADPSLIHLTAWDSEADAQEYVNAQRHVFVGQKLTPAQASPKRGHWSYTDPAGALWSIRKMGKAVLTLMAAPSELVDPLEAEIVKRWRVGGRRLKIRD